MTYDEEEDNLYNDLGVIEEVPETVPEPAEVVMSDVMLPRNVSRYVKPLR